MSRMALSMVPPCGAGLRDKRMPPNPWTHPRPLPLLPGPTDGNPLLGHAEQFLDPKVMNHVAK